MFSNTDDDTVDIKFIRSLEDLVSRFTACLMESVVDAGFLERLDTSGDRRRSPIPNGSFGHLRFERIRKAAGCPLGITGCGIFVDVKDVYDNLVCGLGQLEYRLELCLNPRLVSVDRKQNTIHDRNYTARQQKAFHPRDVFVVPLAADLVCPQ